MSMGLYYTLLHLPQFYLAILTVAFAIVADFLLHLDFFFRHAIALFGYPFCFRNELAVAKGTEFHIPNFSKISFLLISNCPTFNTTTQPTSSQSLNSIIAPRHKSFIIPVEYDFPAFTHLFSITFTCLFIHLLLVYFIFIMVKLPDVIFSRRF